MSVDRGEGRVDPRGIVDEAKDNLSASHLRLLSPYSLENARAKLSGDGGGGHSPLGAVQHLGDCCGGDGIGSSLARKVERDDSIGCEYSFFDAEVWLDSPIPELGGD